MELNIHCCIYTVDLKIQAYFLVEKFGFQNLKFSVEFRRVRISLIFDTWLSNFKLYSSPNLESIEYSLY